jgi:capsular polysaccharide biosynthesis protein
MEDKDNIQIDLRELFDVFLSKLGYIIICAVVCAVAAFFFTKLALPYQYTSSVSLYVTNNTYTSGISDSVNISDVNASQQLVDTYRIILSDDVVMDNISERLNEEYDQADLSRFIDYALNDNDELMPSTDSIKKCIDFSAVEETEILKVSVTTGSPKLSAEICSYITEIAPETIIRVIGAGSVEPIGKVKVPKAPSGPNVKKNTAMGFVAGFVLALAIVFLIYFMDNTLTNGDAFKNRIDLPVLGEIPSYDLIGKGEGQNEK